MQNRKSKKRHSKKRNLVSYEVRLSKIQKPLPPLPLKIQQQLKKLVGECLAESKKVTIFTSSLMLTKLPTLPKH